MSRIGPKACITYTVFRCSSIHGVIVIHIYYMQIKCTIEQPESAAGWDIDELQIQLSIDGISEQKEPIVSCGVKNVLPKRLTTAISEKVIAEWITRMTPRASASGPASWELVAMLEFVENSFSALLCSVPDLIESYEGCDDTGASMRRYTIVEEAGESESSEEDKDDTDAEDNDGADDGLDPEERERRAKVIAAKRAAKEAAAREAEKERQALAHRRRQEAEEGIVTEARPAQISKKEREAAYEAKKKQGVRMAKTGQRRTKYAGPGSKVEKEEQEKKSAGKKK
eukprot:m.837610 g.837610  ORF g.837610 m.837610 type:complete len:284 (-) comp23461_c0_seq22:3112-3963(-)